jgi:hypothetical protein
MVGADMSTKLSKRSIERRNERINGKSNARSLEFMNWIKVATIEELARQRQSFFEHWQRIAIDREIGRRDRATREGQTT